MRIAAGFVLGGAGALAVAGARAGEDPRHPPYVFSEPPRYALWTDHAPLEGWRIERVAKGKFEVMLRASGWEQKARGAASRDNPASRGLDEELYLLHFDYKGYRRSGGNPIEGMDGGERPVFLGWDFFDFSTRFGRNTGERGVSRNYVIPGEFTGIDAVPLTVPPFQVETRSRESAWQKLLLPVVVAEGHGDYTVINAFDKAGMTVGFCQMAAHTPNDLIPMMKHLLADESLRRDRYANPERWFPELGLTSDGKLGYRGEPGGAIVASLEEPTRRTNGNEGFRRPPDWAAYYREDFVRFCNPDLKAIDEEELHFAARWLMWSLSPEMRRAQLGPVKENVLTTLQRVDSPSPRISGAAAAIAAVLLHWNDGEASRKRVATLLRQPSMLKTFLQLEGRADDPKAERVNGMLLSKETSWFRMTVPERKVLNPRIRAVRELFEREPSLLRALLAMELDLETGDLRMR